uniref:Uncharacterized protein n=1 Tax=Tanacetum cinerariifolium TaxID=118510 RepID=A0A6L2K9A3_TANCI|nr:hypothetical protein [Tanacetum cinerariifolium]
MTLPNPQKHVVPTTVLTKSTLVPITAARPVTTAVAKLHVTRPRPAKSIVTKPHSPPRRYINRSPSPKASNFPPKVTIVQVPQVNTAKGNPHHALKNKGVIDSGCSRHMTGNMSYLSDFKELNCGYVAFCGNPKGGKISGKGKFDRKVDEGFLVGYSVSSKAFRVFNKKAREESVQQYVLFPVWSSGFTNPQNTDGDVAFDVKEPEFEGKKPQFEVYVSPSSSTQTKKHDDKTKREAKGKIPAIGKISTNNTNTFSAAGHSNAAVSPTHGKSLYVDASHYPEDLNMPEFKDITYSDDEEDVGAEADFTNLEITITVSPIPTTRVHKDHPVTQIIEEPKRVHQALKDPSWIEAIQNELLQFKMQKVWVLVDLPHGKRAIGHTQEEGIDYEEVFAPVARIEAIRLFLAYASFMGFMVYQMDVKSAFLYGTIEEEVYVCQPLGFKDPDYTDKVYKVVKALYGLHQAPRAWYETLANYLLENGFQRGKINQTLFIKRQKGLQVKQKQDGIFISQDKYVAEILRKFCLTDGKSASTPIDIKKPLLKDLDGKDVDVHTYRSMIGSLMYLISSRPDIMFAYHKDSPFNLVAYSNSEYASASLDRKYTTGGCQFLRCRLISWQCKKQTIMATSSIEAEYVAAASCCAQVLWIQNQLLDYGLNVTAVSSKFLLFDASEGFDQIINSLNASSIKYALTAQVGDLTLHSTKYSSPALTQMVFATMIRVGKGFSGVDTPLFKDMLVTQQVDESAAEVNVNDVPAAGVADEGTADVNADAVLTVVNEPSIPSPTPSTQSPPPSQDLPSTSQVQPTPSQSPQFQPSSPQQQPQPSHDAEMSVDLLHTLLETCTTLTRRVEQLEQDKIAQALEITKFDTSDDTVMDDVSKQGRIIASMDADVDVTLKDVAEIAKEVALNAEIKKNADDDEIEPTELQEVVEVVTTAKLITEVVTAASATITAAALILTTVAVPTLTTAPSAARRRKGVVIRDPEESATPFTIIHSEAKSKDKGKEILVEEPKPLKKQAQIEQDEAYARELEAELNKNINWDDVIDQVQRKEKEDNDKFNSNMAFSEKTREKMEEEDRRALKRTSEMSNDEDYVYTEATPLARKVPVVDYEIYTENNKPYYTIIRADGSPQLFLSFLSLLRNIDREYLEVLWFTLDQMLNNVRLEVEEESKVSLELLRFVRQQQEGFRPEQCLDTSFKIKTRIKLVELRRKLDV